MRTLLIVEDDPGLREQMKWAFCEDFEVREADTLEGTLEAFRDGGPRPDLLCLDMGLEGRHDRGLEVIDAVLAEDRSCKVVAVTASADEAMGREAIRRGAFDYLRKPIDAAALRVLLDRALRIRDLEEDEPSWSPAQPAAGGTPADPDGPPALLGGSEPMRKVAAAIRRLAPLDAGVLITGEAGTGRGLCARALHALGPRRDKPFVAIHCGAVPENLLDCELFGFARGAFAGALDDRPGLIETADGGTLFLEGVADVPPALQAKLLRFLEDRQVRRVGESRTRTVDVRVLASTTAAATPVPGSAGAPPQPGRSAFRPSLEMRLGEFEINLPPLRERGRDALLIAAAVVEKNRRRFSQPRLRLSSRAEKLILSHGWPGNIRELEDRLNRASLACRGQIIEDEDLQIGEGAAGSLNYREQRRLFERTLLLNALTRTNGNVSLAARTMGVTRPTFYDMMKKSGVSLRLEPR